jgi:choice-of-anchor C domain-containing protein
MTSGVRAWTALAAAASLCVLVAARARAVSLVVNGGFESPVIAGELVEVPTGVLDAWTVGGGGVDHVGSLWQAADGSQSLDLNRNGAGSIYQDLPTLPGQAYEISFSLSGNPLAVAAKRLVVRWGATIVGDFSFDSAGTSTSQMSWTPQVIPVLATAGTTRLTFLSLTGSMSGSLGTGGFYGPALDRVAVVPVPEPGSALLLAVACAGLLPLQRRARR